MNGCHLEKGDKRHSLKGKQPVQSPGYMNMASFWGSQLVQYMWGRQRDKLERQARTGLERGTKIGLFPENSMRDLEQRHSKHSVVFQKADSWSSHWSTIGSVASLKHWDTGSIPIPAQWVEDLMLPQLWCRLQLWLGSDPWPGDSTLKKRKKADSWLQCGKSIGKAD